MTFRLPHRVGGSEDRLDQIESWLSSGDKVVAQFAGPDHTPAALRRLDEMAHRYGSALQIRFFGFHGATFDLRTLGALPHVANLSVDCLGSASNYEALADLAHLRKLNIGIIDTLPADLLTCPSLRNLESLTLGENRTQKVDLSPLANYPSLRNLHIVGFTNGIETIGCIGTLERLGLSRISNKQTLAWINKLHRLRELMLILGGRTNIDEIANTSIEDLEIIRVKGLSEIRPSHFPNLQSLKISDQIQVERLSFDNSNERLRLIRISNCKTLSQLEGLSHLPALEELRLAMTCIDFDDLVTQGLPAQLQKLGFFTGKTKANASIAERITSLGYDPC